MTGHAVVVGFNATQEAADGLALGRLLAHLTGGELVIARVLRDMIERPGHSLSEQREVRRRTLQTHQAVVAALPDEAGADVVPLLDANLARSLHGFAEAEDAAFLVLGSSHRHGAGRWLLGGSAGLVIDGAHCPVAVASPGFRTVRGLVPPVIGVAFDGEPHSLPALHVAAALAVAANAPLRVMTVGRDVPDTLPGVELPAGAVERVRLTGDAAHTLADETSRTGILVMGSRGHGPLSRVLLGSVSARVVQDARCPVVICPPGAAAR